MFRFDWRFETIALLIIRVMKPEKFMGSRNTHEEKDKMSGDKNCTECC